jgi:protein-L-isoaspartate(D-aspartate) O-methyltransferase
MSDSLHGDNHDDAEALKQALADKLRADGTLADPAVEAAFRAVGRHLFLPDIPVERAYANDAIVTKREGNMPISSSSQPSMMAIMLEQLDLRPGDRVLEIGTATGYNAALMAHIVGEKGSVTTIDIDDDLVAGAREHLAAAGFDRVHVVCADGAFGYPANAPYDRIIATVGMWDLPPAWLDQLAEGGRVVLPLAILGDIQESVAFERRGPRLEVISHKGCGFVHMRGAFARPEGRRVQIGPHPDIHVLLGPDDALDVEPDAVYELLQGPHRDADTGVRVSEGELYGRLFRWLGYSVADLYTIAATGAAAAAGIVPFLFGQTSTGPATLGLIRPGGMALLMRAPGTPLPEAQPDRSAHLPLWVRSYGDGDELARGLADDIAGWDRAGRPVATEGVDIQAYIDRNAYAPEPGDVVVDKENLRLVLKRRA